MIAAFRPLGRDDVELIRAWLADSSGTGLSVPPGESWGAALLGGPRLECFLACDRAGTPVGFLRLEFIGKAAAEVTVLVAPAARARGIGRAILVHAEQRARARSVRLLLAHLRKDNAAAHQLFTRAGYSSKPSRLPEISCFERRLAASRGKTAPLVIDP
jgi:GNAT superfamily N-acetyltransferase